MSGYWTDALVWSIVGFICGYCFARTRSVQIPPYLREGDMPMVGGHAQSEHGRWWKQPVAIVMIILSIVTVVQAVIYTMDRSAKAECQAKIDARLLVAQERFRREYEETWTFILNNTTGGREVSRKEFEKHLDDLDSAPLPSTEELRRC